MFVDLLGELILQSIDGSIKYWYVLNQQSSICLSSDDKCLCVYICIPSGAHIFEKSAWGFSNDGVIICSNPITITYSVDRSLASSVHLIIGNNLHKLSPRIRIRSGGRIKSPMEIFPVIKCYPNKDTKRRAFCRKSPLKGSPNCGPACERSEGKSFPRVFEQLMPLISTGSLRGVRISQSAVRGKQSGTFAQLHVVLAYTTFEDQKGR